MMMRSFLALLLFSSARAYFLTPPSTSSKSAASTSSFTRETPGNLRRQLFGQAKPPKISLPLPLISAVVAALKEENPLDAIPVFFRILAQEQAQNDALPIAYKPFSSLSFAKDCVSLQQQARSSPVSPFLLELTPAECNLEPNDRQGQLQWLQDHTSQLKQWKLSHGAVYFQQWAIFKNQEGINQVSELFGTPCRDPKEVRGSTPMLEGSTTIYETLNNPDDAATHLGLHFEGIPGIMPSSALFSCFQPAESGGEFLLCDARRVFVDLDTHTLASLERNKLRPTFAELPYWLASPPFLQNSKSATRYWREVLALATDLARPTDDFFLDIFPSSNDGDESTTCLKLTTHAAVPVILHPTTSEPVFFSGIDSGEGRNFQRDNPHLAAATCGGADDNDNGGGKYASEVFDVLHGNGNIISETDLANVRQACKANTRKLLMKPGDAVFLDNFSVMHGRKTFEGTRKHTVVWFLD